jgi:membrane protein
MASAKLKHYRDNSFLFLKLLRKRIWSGEAFDEAAALAYHTLFSLLPIFILVMLILSLVSSRREGETSLEEQVQHFLFSQFNIDTLSATTQSVKLSDMITTQIEHARKVVRHPITGAIGFVLLLYSASKIMLAMEKSFNRIYGGAAPRSWTRRITLYWSVLTLGPVLGAVSLVITNRFFALASAHPITRPITLAAGLFVSWLLLLLLYKIIPGAKVNWRPALVGSFVAAIFWECAKSFFAIYVSTTLAGNNWYGALAILPLFMFWVYLLWTFTMVGLQIAYILQHFTILKRRHAYQKTGTSLITDLNWIFPLAVLLVRKFHEGKSVTSIAAADALNIPSEITSELLRGMEQSKIVHRVGTNAFALARPPEKITGAELLGSARSICDNPVETGPSALSPAARTPALAKLSTDVQAIFRDKTLAEMAGDSDAQK